MRAIRNAAAGLAILGLGGCLDLEKDYVAVVGVGEARQFPDYASMMVTVVKRGKTAAEATTLLNSQVAQLREVAGQFDLTDEDIRSAYFAIDPYSERVTRSDGTRVDEPAGFQAEQTLSFRTADVEKAGDLLGALIMAGGEQVSNPVYLIKDEAPLFEKARKLAIEDANRRASEFAVSAGRVLGSAEVIEESGTESQRLEFRLRDRIVERYAQSESGASADAPAFARMSPRESVYTRPEEISVAISIYAKYALN